MKRPLFALVLLMIAPLLLAQENALQVMSFNLRLNTPVDGTNGWPHRKDKVTSQVLFHQAHVLGVQEALWDQMQDLAKAMPQYKYIGVARGDGQFKNEFSAIFYDTNRIEMLESDTFWLSETPKVPGSVGWDAALTRIVTWGKYKDRKTGKLFYHFNTHFDHKGKVARKESASMLLREVDRIAGQSSVIVTGDFNAHPKDEPIRILTDPQDPLHFVDTKAISKTPHYGPHGTVNGFRHGEVGDEPIDYIFVKGKARVWQHASLSQTWKGQFASDHFAQFVRLEWE